MKDVERPFYSVSELNLRAKGALERDPSLCYVSVRGEIASYKEYANAVYFDLKDERSVLPCVMWGKEAALLPFQPKIGDEVVAFGSVTMYAQKGRYQFSALSLSLFGKGEALLRLKALKEQLEKEGLFDASKKKAIPAFPKRIGAIVGDHSAAEADLIRNISRRWPYAELYIFPALVQGKGAPEDIRRALRLAMKSDLDTLILARGGGSNDDLDAFNDEMLVREFASCPIPKIAAIGHEIDFTLVDYAADLRVSTPTGAAEASTPDQNEIFQSLVDVQETLLAHLSHRLHREEEKFLALANRPFFARPSSIYEKGEEGLELALKRLDFAMLSLFQRKEAEVDALEGKLSSLDHHRVLERGYSLAYSSDGKIIKSVDDIKKGNTIKTVLKDGTILGVAEGVEHGRKD